MFPAVHPAAGLAGMDDVPGPLEQTKREVSSSFVGTLQVVFPKVPGPALYESQALYILEEPPALLTIVPLSQVPSFEAQNTVGVAEPELEQVPPE